MMQQRLSWILVISFPYLKLEAIRAGQLVSGPPGCAAEQNRNSPERTLMGAGSDRMTFPSMDGGGVS